MRVFVLLVWALAGTATYAETVFSGFAGKYRVVRYFSEKPACLSEQTVFPCLKIGEVITISSGHESASVGFGKTVMKMETYDYQEDGHYSYSRFFDDGVTKASWQKVSNSNISKNRAVSIEDFLQGYYKFILIPGWHHWDDSRFELILERL